MHDPKRCPWEFRAVKLSSNAQLKAGTQRWSSDIQAIHISGVPISSAYQILRIHFLSVQSYQIKKLQAYKDFCVTQATSEVCKDLRSSSWWTTATSEVWQWPLFWAEALCLFKSSGSPLCFGEAPFRGLTKLRQTGDSVLRNTEKACKHCKAPESWAILGGECRVKPQEALTAQLSVACSGKAALLAEGRRGLTREGARGGAVLGAGLGQIGRRDRELRSGDQCGDHKGGKTGELQVWGGVGRGLRGGLGAYIWVFRIHTSCRYLSDSVYMRKVYFYIPQTAYMLKK